MIKGMSRHTGKTIRDDGQLPAHLQQSLHDILSTLIGTRICRRNYGSLLPHLIDQPCNDITKLKIMNGSATAIIRFEPRLKIKQVQVSSADRQNTWDVTLIGTYSQYNQNQTFKQSYTFGAAA